MHMDKSDFTPITDIVPIHIGKFMVGSDDQELVLKPVDLKNSNKMKPISFMKNKGAVFFVVLWYFFSGCTLFLNKYIVAYLKGDPLCLGYSLMLMTLICGFVQFNWPMGMVTVTRRKDKPEGFAKNMIIVGTLRFTTVFLGLVALNYVEVSFTETVKSTAPAFTVVIARLLVGEITGPLVNLSLLPVMGGLALCSANEISFNMAGFLAALATNASECMQNVYSKMLISSTRHKYSPIEMQYYTSLASFGIQIATAVYFIDWPKTVDTFYNNSTLLLLFIINGVFFHLQTLSEYILMEYISPVTHSVMNTAKRALLIWMSVILFGNPVTFLSGVGTTIVIVGILLYTKAKEIETKMLEESKPISFLEPAELL